MKGMKSKHHPWVFFSPTGVTGGKFGWYYEDKGTGDLRGPFDSLVDCESEFEAVHGIIES